MVLVKLIITAVTIVLAVMFIVNLKKTSQYDELFDALDDGKHPFKKVYPVGLNMLEKLGFDYQSNKAKRLKTNLDIMYGKKNGDLYIFVTYGESISLAWLVLMIGLTLSAFSPEMNNVLMIAGFSVVAAFLVYYYYFTQVSNELKKRSDLYLSQFPNVVSSIALLVNAGMILRDAWEQVAYSDDKEINLQMQLVCDDIKNGVSEKDAYYFFASRCACNEIKKFVSFLVQAMDKGSRDLSNVLVAQSQELWQVRRESALKKGELASNKLLIPILLIFGGILIMVAGPIMSNLSA